MKIRLLFRLRYVAVNLLNGRGWTKLSSHRLKVTSSLLCTFSFDVFSLAFRYFYNTFLFDLLSRKLYSDVPYVSAKISLYASYIQNIYIHKMTFANFVI